MFSTNYEDILKQIQQINPMDYAQTRNFLDGAVTRLSPYITRGFLTLPQVRDTVLENYSKEDAKKFIQELAWREYFQKVWQARGDEIFSDIRFEQDGVVSTGVPTNVLRAQTGVAVLDAGIESLYETGYMHNHMRMSIASVVCNLGGYEWLEPAKWMYYHLLDGDPASNMLSWQWVAGTSISKQYTTSQSLINYWSKTEQLDTFLDFERDDFSKQDVPEELDHLSKPELETKLPHSEKIDFSDHESIFVYHPWHLSPEWRKGEAGLRILLLQPSVFKKLPVSEKVLDFIIRLAKDNIPDIKVVVTEEENLLEKAKHSYIKTVEHPTIKHIDADERQWLFPHVQGYHKSFFAFWKECEKYF